MAYGVWNRVNGRVCSSHGEDIVHHFVCSLLHYLKLKGNGFEDMKRGTFSSSLSSVVQRVVLTQHVLAAWAPFPVCSV